MQVKTNDQGEATAAEVLKLQSKIKRGTFVMGELMGLENPKNDQRWELGESERAEEYRRQEVPAYLLHCESSKFPRYVDSSDLPAKNLQKLKNLSIGF